MSNYQNFRDPFGLVWRMLRSGSSSARNALIREGFRKLLAPIDFCTSLREQTLIRRHGATTPKHPLLLIVGPPRSGTTLVYQVLARSLKVAYPSNAAGILSRSPILSSRWSRRWLTPNREGFESYYGQTAGLADCNDGFPIWDRWLGEDRYRPADELTAEQSESMRRFFNTWTQLADRPLLNKNNRNALAIELLAEHLPQARFIVVMRNPINVAQSLLLARQKIQGSRDVPWGLRGKNLTQSSDAVPKHPSSPIDEVCDQVSAVETQMEEQLQQVPSERVIRLSYESFCEQPAEVVSQICQAFKIAPVTSVMNELCPFTVADTRRVSESEYAHIRRRFGASADQRLIEK